MALWFVGAQTRAGLLGSTGRAPRAPAPDRGVGGGQCEACMTDHCDHNTSPTRVDDPVAGVARRALLRVVDGRDALELARREARRVSHGDGEPASNIMMKARGVWCTQQRDSEIGPCSHCPPSKISPRRAELHAPVRRVEPRHVGDRAPGDRARRQRVGRNARAPQVAR